MKKKRKCDCVCVYVVELCEFVGVITCFRTLYFLSLATIVFTIVHLFSFENFLSRSTVRSIFIGTKFGSCYFRVLDGLNFSACLYVSLSLALTLCAHFTRPNGLSAKIGCSSIRTFIYTNVNCVFPFRFECGYSVEQEKSPFTNT